MNRNAETRAIFAPTVKMGRTKFPRKQKRLLSFDAGELIPFFREQCVMPGDTIKATLHNVTRMLTPRYPTMDNAYLEYFYFWVPMRLIWEHTKEFWGENTTGAWTQETEYIIPKIKVKFMPWPWNNAHGSENITKINYIVNVQGGTTITFTITNTNEALKYDWDKKIGTNFSGMVERIEDFNHDAIKIDAYQPKTLGDYMGIPDLGYNVKSMSEITLTATTTLALDGTNAAEILNELIDMTTTYLTTNSVTKEISALTFRAYQLIYDNWFRNQNYIEPINPKTYWGDATVNYSTEAPYKGGKVEKINRIQDYFSMNVPQPQKGDAVLTPLGTSAPIITGTSTISQFSGEKLEWKNADGTDISALTNLTLGITGNGDTTGAGGNITLSSSNIVPSNLYADLSNAVAATVNAQRLSFATQRILERDARGGTRFPERIKAAYGVTNDNITMEIPEYLGGGRIPLNIQTVQQNSETGTTPLGSLGGYSQTNFSAKVFTKSFTEYGIILGICAIRTDRTYSQGIDRDFFKFRKLDFYDPALAFLGMQPTYNYEIYADGTSEDDEVWGYTQRWEEYRNNRSEVAGEFRPTYPQPLLQWTYTDDYGSRPVLGKEWLQEDKARISRSLAVSDEINNQFFGDFLTKCEYIRVMPLYSIPGLIDHY